MPVATKDISGNGQPEGGSTAFARALRVGGAVGSFFALKVAVGLALVVQSAHRLTVSDFGSFSQLFLFLALLSTISAAGVQNGVVRQISAAGGAFVRERRTSTAAILIWGCFGLLILFLSIIFRGYISIFLIGSSFAQVAIPLIAAAALAAGGGQLLCAILPGRDRAPTSLLLQGTGLLIGGAACWWRLGSGDAVGAVLAYAAGPIATSVLALPFAWKWLPRRRAFDRELIAEVRLLLAFSGSFLITSTLMPMTLFVLRYTYRDQFGAEALGFWLAANRVSDVTSQLLGLYMGQVYLPSISRAIARGALVRRLIYITVIGGCLVMTAGLFVFMSTSSYVVSVFLSERFIPAIPFVTGYLAGDILRVLTSVALYTALAQGRFNLYWIIEAATAALLAVYIGISVALHYPAGAYLGYVAAHGTMAVILSVIGLRWIARNSTLGSPENALPNSATSLLLNNNK